MKTKEQIHDEQISPLMQQIIKICQENKIAMIASFHLNHDGNEDLMCSTALIGGEYPAIPPLIAAANFLKHANPVVAMMETAAQVTKLEREKSSPSGMLQ